jgi:DNA gyrase subunit A
MDLDGGELVGMDIIGQKDYILVITEKGFGKRTLSETYRPQGRGGKGVINLKTTERNGNVVGFRQVDDEDSVILITDRGRLIRTLASGISVMGRATQGVKVMDLHEDERVVDLAVALQEADEAEANGETGEDRDETES